MCSLSRPALCRSRTRQHRELFSLASSSCSSKGGCWPRTTTTATRLAYTTDLPLARQRVGGCLPHTQPSTLPPAPPTDRPLRQRGSKASHRQGHTAQPPTLYINLERLFLHKTYYPCSRCSGYLRTPCSSIGGCRHLH